MDSKLVGLNTFVSLLILACIISCSKSHVPTPAPTVTSKPKVRSVEGIWVCQFSGGGTTKGSTMTFLSTGNVTIHDPKEKDETLVFVSEPFTENIARKEKATGKPMGKEFNEASASLGLTFCYVVSFYKGSPASRGKMTGRMFYEPYNQILFDPFNEEWRRKGDTRKDSDASNQIPSGPR